jgi:hypothetical protein
VNPVIPVGLISFNPNPSANLVSVGGEGGYYAVTS